jgi:hypothetical protein
MDVSSQEQQGDLASYFNKSVSAVQLYADHFEHDVVRPAFASSNLFFRERPITATFAATFSLLSFIPVLSFVGASIFATVAVVLVALLAVVLACGMALIAFLSLLLFALCVNFFVALSFTSLVTLSYALLRLAMLVRERGSAGISHWIAEIQGFILHPGTVLRGDPQGKSLAHGSDSATTVAQLTPASHTEDIKEESPSVQS